MSSLAEAEFWATLLFLGGLTAAIAAKLLNGGINTRYLLYGRKADGKMYFSPERVQLLVFTIWTASSYLLDAIEHRGSGRLPVVQPTTLVLLGSSHVIYLSGKAYFMLLMKTVNGEK